MRGRERRERERERTRTGKIVSLKIKKGDGIVEKQSFIGNAHKLSTDM